MPAGESRAARQAGAVPAGTKCASRHSCRPTGIERHSCIEVCRPRARRPHGWVTGPPDPTGSVVAARAPLQPLQMCVLEPARIFKTEAEQPVEADVRRQNERQIHKEAMVCHEPEGNDGPDGRVRVDEVVHGRTYPRSPKVTEHRDVGGEEEHRKNHPTSAVRAVPPRSERQRREPFKTHQEVRADQDPASLLPTPGVFHII